MEPLLQEDVLTTLCLAVAAGMFLIVLSRRLYLPTIVFLLFGGIALGPEGLNLVRPASLGSFLPVIVSLSVGLILFEGGLTLDLRGYFQGSREIKRLLTIGVLVTWLGSALCVWAVFRIQPAFALLSSSLIIVTGPTVIVPLLKRIKVVPKLHSILHWEGVLIDTIGVFIAIFCFEWVVAQEGGMAVVHFAYRAVAGLTLGFVGGYGIYLLIRWKLVHESLVNAFAFAAAILIFGVAESVMPEAGLLSVTVAGLVVGWKHPVELKQIRQFKAEITDLLIGLLFVLLSARLDLSHFERFGRQGLLLVGLIILVVRPLNVWLSTLGGGLSWREKTFLSWVAPRGIVAASMASLFAIALGGDGARASGFDPSFLETLTYSVIVATVVIQGFTAGWVARLLGLRRPTPTGWLLVGANALGRGLAAFLEKNAGVTALLIDSNPRHVAESKAAGLNAFREDALNAGLAEEIDAFQKAGNLLALTDNAELNELVCQRWREAIDAEALFRWSPTRPDEDNKKRGRTHGQVALDRLPRPSVISGEIGRGEAALVEWTAESDGEEAPGLVLAAVRNKRPVTAAMTDDDFSPREGDRCLILKRSGGFFVRALSAGAMLDLSVDTQEALYDRLVETVTALCPKVQADALRRDLAEGEKLFPAFLGHGVAVPHAYSGGTAQRVCLLVRLKPALEVTGQDEKVNLVLFILSPAGDPEGHLATLAEVARFCASENNRRMLMEAAELPVIIPHLRGVLR